MPIKPFSLSGGGGLGSAVGRWNGSRNLPDGDGSNGTVGGIPDGGRCGNEGNGGGGERLKLLLSSFGSGLSFNLSNLLLMAKSTPGGLTAFL